MTTRSVTRTNNTYRFTSNDKVAQNLTKRKSIIGAIQGFGKPEFFLTYLVVGGGGAGGSAGGGGGGGGGVVIGTMGFTDNPLYSGFSATASLYYQRSPGTGRCEMQVTSVGSGYIQAGSVIDIPGVSPNMPVIVVDQRSGTAGGIGNYRVSTVLTAPTAPSATAQPTATPPAFALTPRTVTGTSGIAYGTPIGVTIGSGGGGRTDAPGNRGSQSNFGFITAHGGGGGGTAGLPGNTDATGAGTGQTATGGGQGAFFGFQPSYPFGFVAGSVQGGYGGVSWRPGADNDVRRGRSGNETDESSPFPGQPGPTETIDRNAQPYSLVPSVRGGGGGACGQDTPTAPSDNSRGGDGGSGYTWPFNGVKYASGGGGASYQPNNNPTDAGGDEAGRGTVFNGGDEMFNGGTAPTGAPLPPYGSKIGFGGPNGENAAQSKRALKNRGGGGGGAFNGGSYFGFPETIRLGVGPLSPSPYPGGLGGGAVWPNDYDYGNPGAPNWRGRNSGSEGGSGGSGVVIIRYPAVFGNVTSAGSPDVSVTPTGFIHYTFTGSGSITLDYNP
jgi:hypothetical protein